MQAERHRALALLCCLGASLHAFSFPPQTNSPRRTLATAQSDTAAALRLLREAEQLSRSFSTWERLDVLLEAAEVADQIDAQSANAWSREAFALAKQMPLGQARAAMQKNALRTLAVHSPDEALNLYRKQDLPAQWGKPTEMGEDPRALSDPSIFSVVWKAKGKKYLRRLISLANYLGKTGQYPYRVMDEIATDVAKDDPHAAKTILGDALRAFRHDPGFRSTNKEFVLFILRTHAVASSRALKEEVETVAEAVEHPRFENARHATYRITVTTPLGNAQFDSERDYLLFRLMPLLNEFDWQLATRLRSTHPGLQHAPPITAKTPVQAAGAVSPDGTASTGRMQTALDKSLVFRVSQMAQAEPDHAFNLANEVTDHTLRTLALVLVVPYERDKQRAKQWMQRGKETLSTMDDGLLKLQLMTALIKSEVGISESESARMVLPPAFALGQCVYETDRNQHPDKPAYLTDGADSLAEIAYAARLVEGEAAETSIRQCPDAILRARLLLSTARALAGMKNRVYLPV